MKTVVSLQDLLELEIRPEGLFAQYQERLERDLAELWRIGLREVGCPGCGSSDSAAAFTKSGTNYRECARCRSLFVTPRPGERELVEFYRRSSSAVFWREQLLPATAAARRDKIVQPRVEWVLDGLAEYAPDAIHGLDVSPYNAPFRDQLSAEGRLRITEEAAGGVDFVTAFDAIDRAADVPALVDRLARSMRSGGLLFLTAPNADGFDLQVLWERHPALTPPDKLNVLSIAGLQERFGSREWELLEVSTPGMFDVDQVRRAVEAEPSAEWPRFVRTLVAARDAKAQRDFQECLQRNRLASFARVVARRR